jgi:dolichol-phosphate mannosyltransferase
MALLPDLDVLFYVHRSMSHSAVVLGLGVVAVVALTYRFRRGWMSLVGVCGLVLLGHPVMDMFQTLTPILYPLVGWSIHVDVAGRVLIGEGLTPTVSAGTRIAPVVFKVFQMLDAPIFTSEGFIVSAMLVAVPVLSSVILRRALTSSMSRKPAIAQLGEAGTSPSLAAAESDSHMAVGEGVNTPLGGGPVSKSDVTVVIPTLNEAEAIGHVIDELRGLGYDDILVVDGYSSDGTAEIARRNNVRVVKQHGIGKAGALRTAIDYVDKPWMLVMDGDFSYDPSGIELMLAHGGEYDEVIGARRKGRENIPIVNRFGNRLIGWLFKLLFGGGLADVCSGMYLLRTDIAKGLDLTTSGFDVEVDVTSQVASIGKVTEVPIAYRKRIGTQKLSSLKDGVRILTTILRLANIHNPALLYSGVASLAAVPGGVILAWVMYRTLVYNVWHSGYALFGVMLFLLGMQAFAVATLSIILKRSDQRLSRSLRRILEELSRQRSST